MNKYKQAFAALVTNDITHKISVPSVSKKV